MPQVLVVRLSSLGDIVLTQPVLEQISREGGRVDLLVHPDYAALGKMLPGTHRVLTSKADLAREYDLVLDLHGTLRARRIISGVRARRIVRYNKRAWARRLLVRWGGRRMFWNAFSGLSDNEQVTAWYAEAACRAGFNPPQALPRLECSEWAVTAVMQILQKAGIGTEDRIAVFAPAAKWAAKQWPLDYFSQTAKMIELELGMIPVFVGTANERPVCEAAVNALGGRALSLAGLTNIPTLAALLSRAGILIANDSGPLHLGLAAGCPVVSLFGPTVPQFGFAPLNHPQARVLSKPMPCRPCSLHGGSECPRKHHDCLRQITPQEAVDAAKDLLRTLSKKKQ